MSLLLDRDFFRLGFLEVWGMEGGTEVRTRTRFRQGTDEVLPPTEAGLAPKISTDGECTDEDS